MAVKTKAASTDRRSRRTESAIEKAFLELASKKDINKITVKDITELADANRGTFYLHYIDIFDLQDKVENRLIDGLCAFTSDDLHRIFSNHSTAQLAQMLEYIRANRQVFGAFFSSSRSMLFMEKITNALEERFCSYLPDKSKEHSSEFVRQVTVFFVNGAVALIRDWLSNNEMSSPAELAAVIESIMSFVDYPAGE